MHQLSQCRLIFDLGIHVDDVCFILKRFPGLLNDPVDMVDREIPPQHVMLCNKDHIRFIQCIICAACLGQVGIQQTAVISCPFRTGSPVTALDFNIIRTLFLIQCQNVQPHRPTLQILQIMLPMDFLHR